MLPEESLPTSALGVTLSWASPDPAHVRHPLLSADERTRCQWFRHVEDRARHATGRVTLRLAAARRWQVAAERIQVRPEPSGRPRIFLDGIEPGHCSIAHAGQVVLVGLADRPCGVDVEEVAKLAPVLDSALVYSPAELAVLGRLDRPSRLDRAARWWTLKEAALKATGQGLAIPPDTVDLRTGTTIELAVHADRIRIATAELAAPAGYRASCAVVVG